VIAAGAIAIVAPAYALFGKPGLASDSGVFEAAQWIATSTPRRSEPPVVLASWTDGHALRAAGLAVVGSPFGTEISLQSLQDEATFFCSVSGGDAHALAHARGVGFVMVREPVDTVFSVQDYHRAEPGLAPPVRETRSLSEGARLEPGPEFHRTVMARLFYGDGMASKRHPEPALGWARLLREELPPDPSGAPDVRQVKTFGIVPGALVRVVGAPPGARIVASARISTNAGRAFTWGTYAVADGEGEAALRVPYATGENGACRALPYAIGAGGRSAAVSVGADDVTSGAELVVDLSGVSGGVPAR
jgi:hypothetical protein